MPMSLRTNPTKKSLFEQEVHRPAKRVKTIHLPPTAKTYSPFDLSPQLDVSKSKDANDQSICSSRPLLPKASVTSSPSHSPNAVSHMDVRAIPQDAAHQVMWIARTIRTIALREWSVEAHSCSLDESTSQGLFRNAFESDCNRKKDDTSKNPENRQGKVAGNEYSPLNEVNLPQEPFTRPDFPFPPILLDPRLADRVFPRRSDDTPNDELRNLCGRVLIQGLSKGSQLYDQHVANELEATIRSSQDYSPYIAAFNALAARVEVVSAISHAMRAQTLDHAKPSAIQTVPDPTEVPSLTPDRTSGLTTPAETVESESLDNSSVNAAITRQTRSSPGSARSQRKAPAISAVGNSPGVHTAYGGLAMLVDRARRSVTADALAARGSLEVVLPILTQSTDPVVNSINRASTVMYEMAHGAPVHHTSGSVQHGLTQDSPSGQGGPSSFTSPLAKSPLELQYVTPYGDGSGPKSLDPNPAFGRRHLVFNEGPDSQSLDDQRLQPGDSVSGIVSQGEGDHEKCTIPASDDEDNGSLTEAQIDGFLALANGGNLKADDSEIDTDDNLPPSDGECTISRPVTPEKISDTAIASVLENIISELITDSDRGHGIAFLKPHVAAYQSVNRQRFAAELQYCLTDAPPLVNIAMSAERSNAIKAFYKHLERRVTRVRAQPLRPTIAPVWPQVPPPLPQITPPPGYQVIYHPACGPPPMATHPHPPVHANAVLRSNAPALPKLAPAPRHRIKPDLDKQQMYGFPRQPDPDAVAEARERIKQRTRRKGWSFATPRLPIKKDDLAVVQGFKGISFP